LSAALKTLMNAANVLALVSQTRRDLRIRNHLTEKMCDAHLEDGHLTSAQHGFLSEADPHKPFDERSAWIFIQSWPAQRI